MTLTEFLLARIAEDEAAAREASPSPWTYPGIESVAGGTLYDATRRIADLVYEQPEDHDGIIVRHLLVPEADANGAHIARHDPDRIRAECEAKRRIVAEHPHRFEPGDGRLISDSWECRTCDTGPMDWWCPTLRLLALPYADHPDYDETWRP